MKNKGKGPLLKKIRMEIILWKKKIRVVVEKRNIFGMI